MSAVSRPKGQGPPAGERLQKVLAAAGVASRRAAEQIILAGRVSVNGAAVTELGTRVKPGDRVALDGQPIRRPEPKVHILLNKPAGYVSTVSDEHDRPTVLDLVHIPERIYPVGRLDFDTTGLLLLSNDGELVRRVLHPSYELDKTYVVQLARPPTREQIARLESGVVLDDQPTAPAQVQSVPQRGLSVLRITIHEGRKRQIRRMCLVVGLEVLQLTRVRFGPLELGDLRSGQWRPLRADEITALRRAVGL